MEGITLRRDDGYDLAKILACMAMLVNHCTFHVPELMWQGCVVARFVMPVFAFILVSRLMEDLPNRGPRLQRNLLLWGIPAQALFMYFNRTEPFSTNILWDFFVGVCLIRINERYGVGSSRPLIVVAMLLTVALGPWMGYTAFLPLGMLFISGFVNTRRNLALAVLLVFSLLANRCYERCLWDNIIFGVALLLAVPVLWISQLLKEVTPRLSKDFFYFFYPFTYLAAIMIDTVMGLKG